MKYPQYTIDHFYSYSFKEGGLTFQQLQTLNKFAAEREIEHQKFQALIHGIDLDGEKNGTVNNNQDLHGAANDGASTNAQQSPLPLFQSPDKYENLSEEERERLTSEMMSKHKQWAGDNQVLGTKG